VLASPSLSQATLALCRAIVRSCDASPRYVCLSRLRITHSYAESHDSITTSKLLTTSRAVISCSLIHPTFLSLQLISCRVLRFGLEESRLLWGITDPVG
jgi:hypothetical protein